MYNNTEIGRSMPYCLKSPIFSTSSQSKNDVTTHANYWQLNPFAYQPTVLYRGDVKSVNRVEMTLHVDQIYPIDSHYHVFNWCKETLIWRRQRKLMGGIPTAHVWKKNGRPEINYLQIYVRWLLFYKPIIWDKHRHLLQIIITKYHSNKW